mmetsp:Transcript_44200/g.32184  ORF Transcript_44200/g.32184 Transcript_44200/m.32184 type:complete len:124 (-) Transcript_44200:35-406(-)
MSLLSDHFQVQKQIVVPDEKEKIQEAIVDSLECHLILTSGGTGFTKRDVTPEATAELLEKRADSISQFINLEAVKIVPNACLSRGVAGVIGNTFVLNLPGSPKAVKENLEIIMRKNILLHILN